MGASTSKTASKASKAASQSVASTARKYPTRVPPASSHTNAEPVRPSAAAQPGPTVHPETTASSTRDESINLDSSDPGLASRLRTIGPVQPSPMMSNSSTFNRASAKDPSTSDSTFVPSASTPSQSIFPTAHNNPAVSLLTARYRIAEEAEKEFANIGRKGFAGRSYLDVSTIRTAIVLRSEGMPEAEIEKRLDLKKGVVRSLGGDVVAVAGL
ncbi:Ribophorin II protein [Rutstroemia sp. NJR-2017a WRK4]|nr:Ribophorin II protein [Rutstroemia sp. NJR-2017a WRK4]